MLEKSVKVKVIDKSKPKGQKLVGTNVFEFTNEELSALSNILARIEVASWKVMDPNEDLIIRTIGKNLPHYKSAWMKVYQKKYGSIPTKEAKDGSNPT